MERRNNYDLAARQAETYFLGFDQKPLIETFGLDADASHIFLRFVARDYRIDRHSGAVERAPDWARAGFDEVLSIFDCLCHSGRPPVLTGDWVLTGSLHHAATGPSSLDDAKQAALLAENVERLPEAVRALGGRLVEGGGDFCCEIPVFGDFSARLRLWLPDEEFPAQLQFLWDRNALSFVHYETIFYIMGHIWAGFEELLA